MLESDVDHWVQSCAALQSGMCMEEVDKMIREEGDVRLVVPEDEKENIVVGTLNNKAKVDTVELEDLEEDQHSESTEKTVAFTEKTDQVLYWKWGSAAIDKRLQLQKFQHHLLTRGNMSQNYTYTVNTGCPPSPTDSQMHGNALMLNKLLRLNAVQFRYKRTSHDCEEVMCRLCMREKWVPHSLFSEHMVMVHGILDTESYGLIALPPPAALFKQQIGNLKFYYAKCSKCITWIRLGKMTDVKSIDSQLEAKEYAASLVRSPFKEGLYTNYFVHFIQCADLCGK